MKFKYLSLITICSICLSYGQVKWFSVGLEKNTINAILLTSKKVLMAGTKDGLYYKASISTGISNRWEKFAEPNLPITAIIELNAEMVAVAAGGGSNSDGIYIGKYSATVDPSYKFTLLTWFESPHALAANGSKGDTLFVGGGKGISMIVQEMLVNPTVIPLKVPEYAFGVERPYCASLLCFPSALNNNSLFAGGYDKGILPGKGHLLQQMKDSMVIINNWNVSAMTQGVFAPVGPLELVVGTLDSGLYSMTSGINPVEWKHWKSPMGRPINDLDAVEGPMQGDQLLIAVDSGVFTGRSGTWQEIGDIPAEPLCFTGGIQSRQGFAGTDNGVYQYGDPTSIDEGTYKNNASTQIIHSYSIDKNKLHLTMNIHAEGIVRVALYNLAGRKLCTVFEGILQKGKRTISRPINAFDNHFLGTGMYLLRVYYNDNCMYRSIIKINN